jgi:curved DNA-binding protein CbpA
MLVIIGYLLYTVVEAVYEVRYQESVSFYTLLGVDPVSTSAYPVGAVPGAEEAIARDRFDLSKWERTVRKSYSNFARYYHPDKLPQNAAASQRQEAETYFHAVTVAKDTLLDPVKRFAYDRFGPRVLEWKHVTTVKDYVNIGTRQGVPFYLGSFGFLILLGVLGYLEFGAFWRYITLVTLLVTEYYSLTRPFYPPILASFINPALRRFGSPPLLPFQMVTIAHKLSITLFIAFAQLGPILASYSRPLGAAPAQQNAAQARAEQMGRIEKFTTVVDAESTALLGTDMAPFLGDELATKTVKVKLRDWLVEQTIRNDVEVRDAVGRVLQRRRENAPAGARGNR